MRKLRVLGRIGYAIIACLLISNSGCIVLKQPGSCSSCDNIFVGNKAHRSEMAVPHEMPCDLYDRKEVLKRWLHAARPSNIIPARIQTCGAQIRDRSHLWGLEQKQKCDEWKAWYEMKKVEANPPPWPKFHPLPSRPAFSRSDENDGNLPEAYGTIATP